MKTETKSVDFLSNMNGKVIIYTVTVIKIMNQGPMKVQNNRFSTDSAIITLISLSVLVFKFSVLNIIE